MPDPTVPNPPSADDQSDHDPRFTLGLTLDVARVLEDHGYEALNGGQIVELQQHLFHFLHGAPAVSCTGSVG